MAKCTYFVLNTFSIECGCEVNYPFIFVRNFTGGATTVVTNGIANVCPSMAKSLLEYCVTLCTGLSSFTGCRIAWVVSESRNCTSCNGSFESTECISVDAATRGAGVITYGSGLATGGSGCCCCY